MTTTERTAAAFEADLVDAILDASPIKPVLERYHVHPSTWQDWQAVATGTLTRWRNGSEVSEVMREWCRSLHRSVLAAKIVRLEAELEALDE